MGLDQTGRIGRVVVDPANPDIVLACALGHAYGPQQDRGVYRTADGGKTWQRTLFVDENTGCSDIAMDRHNPRILFAGMWQIEIHTWGRTSGGTGSGLFKSVDGGVTWKRLDRSRPAEAAGRQDLRAGRAQQLEPRLRADRNRRRPAGRSTARRPKADRCGAATMAATTGSWSAPIAGCAAARTTTRASPSSRTTRTRLYFLSAEFTKTLDGGKTSIELSGRLAPVGDNHDMWIDPTNGDRFVVAHDDGLSFSVNRGRSWHQIQLPVAQMYHVATDNQIPYNVYGNRQDGPSTRGPSNSRLAKQSDEDVAGPIPRGHVALGRRRRERLGDSRSDRQQHRLGERHRLRQPRRHRRALRRADAAGARGRDLAGGHDRHRGGRPEVPLQLDVPGRHLAARSQHRLCGIAARPSHDRRRPDAGR